MFERPTDITIAGAGPAGLALGSALARRGQSVIVADPTAERAWPNRYGAWRADLDRTPYASLTTRTFTRVTAGTAQNMRTLPGEYSQVDAEGLRARLRADLLDAGGRIVTARVASVDHDAHGASVHLDSGDRLQSRLVVDATGRGALSPRQTAPTAFQAAYGTLVRVRSHPWSADQAVLMDFDATHLDPAERQGPPTFLYALPQSDDVVFVEETSLAATPALSMDHLQARLDARLAHLGIEVLETLHVERCLIPMNGSIPDRGRSVPFGGAAAYVHPATGYQLTRSLRAADAVADAIVSAPDAHTAAARAWDALWPASERRTRALHILGLGLLLSLDAEETAAFFDAFFSMPEAVWRAYLDATSAPGAVARAMSRVFVNVPGALRREIVAHAIGAGRTNLLAVLSPQLGGAS